LLITPQTDIRDPISVGDLVEVRAITAPDGTLVAVRLRLTGEINNENHNFNGNENANHNVNDNENANDNDRHGGETRFIGVVESISSGSWVVSGVTVLVTPQTEIRGTISVGDLVEVRAITAPNGALVAVRLRLEGEVGNENGNVNHNENENENQNVNNNENDNENINENENFNGNENANNNENDNDDRHGGETRFSGVVESMSGGTWVVSGVTLLITPQTEIRDTISVGDLVEVRAITATNGSLIAVRLELAD
jgi:hypothetical protein